MTNRDTETAAWITLTKILVGVYFGSYILGVGAALAIGGAAVAAIIRHKRK